MKFREIRHTYPQPTIRVYTPNNPRRPAAVKLVLKLQTKTMEQLCRMGRRMINNILRAKVVGNDKALAYFVSCFKQVSAEHRFRITKKTP